MNATLREGLEVLGAIAIALLLGGSTLVALGLIARLLSGREAW